MKKIFAIIAIVCVAMCFAACATNSSNEDETTNVDSTEVVVADTTVADSVFVADSLK